MSRAECDELKERLADIVEESVLSPPVPPEGDLSGGPAGERSPLLAHAAACPECGELLRSYRSLLQGMKGLERVRAPADLFDRVWKRIETESTQGPSGAPAGSGAPGTEPTPRARVASGRSVFIFYRIAAGLLIAAALGFFLYRVSPERPTPELAMAPAPRAPQGPPVPERQDSARALSEPVAAEEDAPLPAEAASESRAESTAALRSPLELADAFRSAETAEGERKPPAAGLLEAGKTFGKSSVFNKDLPERFVVRLPAGSTERLDSLVSLASSIAAPGAVSVGAAGRNRREKLISFDVDPERLPELKKGLEGFQADKRFLEERAAGLPVGRLYKGPAAGVPGEKQVVHEELFRQSVTQDKNVDPRRNGEIALEGKWKLQAANRESNEVAAQAPAGIPEKDPAMKAEVAQSEPRDGGTGATGSSTDRDAGRQARRRYQAPLPAPAAKAPAQPQPASPAPAPEAPTDSSRRIGLLKEGAAGAAGKASEEKITLEQKKSLLAPDKLSELKGLKLDHAFSTDESGVAERGAETTPPRVRVEIFVEIE
jgi:hypothetical protein